jgi:hypothetical protein
MPVRNQLATTSRIVPASRTLNVLYVVVCVLPALFGLSLGIPALLDRSATMHEVTLYHAQCPALSASPTSTAACPITAARVVAHYAEGTGRMQSQWITIVLPSGRHYSLSIDDPNMWAGLTVGQQIAVQVWHGRITGLVAQGRAMKTYDNPDLVSDDNGGRLLFAGISVAACATLLCLPLFVKSAAGAAYKRSIVLTGIVLFIGVAFKLLL